MTPICEGSVPFFASFVMWSFTCAGTDACCTQRLAISTWWCIHKGLHADGRQRMNASCADDCFAFADSCECTPLPLLSSPMMLVTACMGGTTCSAPSLCCAYAPWWRLSVHSTSTCAVKSPSEVLLIFQRCAEAFQLGGQHLRNSCRQLPCNNYNERVESHRACCSTIGPPSVQHTVSRPPQTFMAKERQNGVDCASVAMTDILAKRARSPPRSISGKAARRQELKSGLEGGFACRPSPG